MTKRATVLADLGFGDAGKGSITDYLVRETGAHTVVRYNGGAQAAHRVVTPDEREHIFAQFGSGTFVPGVKTLLSQYMMIDPVAMLNEEEHLYNLGAGVDDAFDRTFVHENAIIITPYHRIVNQLREEARGVARHG